MKIKIFIHLYFIVFTVSAQQPIKRIVSSNTDNQTKMKKLTLDEFNMVKDRIHQKKMNFFKNDSVYELRYEDNHINKTSAKQGLNFKKLEIYEVKSLQLIKEGDFFFRIPVGLHIEYDSQGQAVKINDYNDIYIVTIDDFINLIRDETGIDLTIKNENVLDVTRGFNTDKNIHFYFLMLKVNVGIIRIIKVNADNGEIFYDAEEYIRG